MMDLLMIGTLLISFGLVWLLVKLRNKNNQVGGTVMILLGIIVLLLGGYLVYALAHPDRF